MMKRLNRFDRRKPIAWLMATKWACLLICIHIAASPLSAHEGDEKVKPTARVLGEINFPTTAKSEEAQDAFIRGMLLLHLFEYPFAREEFVKAQHLEPGFALAYWGEAMTHNHPIWDVQDLVEGRAALEKLAKSGAERLDKTDSPKEKALLASLDILYGAGPKAQRDREYSRTLEWMVAKYPDDHEIQLFYALSLFGVQAGVREVSTYMLCTAIAQSVFSANPKHPGAAHYLIHGVDDPEHAVLGLSAARALYVLAPDAGHSLHMTSHIFTALGMWDDVVMANENAAQVRNKMYLEQEVLPRNWGHYNFWLLYGYLQQGRVEEARSLLMAAIEQAKLDGKPPEDRMILVPDRNLVGSVVQMWSRYLIETRDWSGEIAETTFNLGDAFDPNLNYHFVKSMGAASNAKTDEARQHLEQFRAFQNELESIMTGRDAISPTDRLYLARLNVMEQEMMSASAWASGDMEEAIRIAKEANRLEGEMPFSYGPPFVDWPSAEWLAELLAANQQHKAAIESFDMQLKRSRQRSNTLSGLMNSQQALGLEAEANYSREKLKIIWHKADPELAKKIR